jgi:hypothetical protein
MVINKLSVEAPTILARCQDELMVQISDNFLINKILCESILRVAKSEVISADNIQKIESIQKLYAGPIIAPGKSIFVNPSSEFSEFYSRAVMLHLQEIIYQANNMLKMDMKEVAGKIERYVMSGVKSIDELRGRNKDEWYGQAHPQGHPFIPIMATINHLVIDAYGKILDEYFKGNNASEELVDRAFTLLKTNDSHYSLQKISPKPNDIERVHVEDVDKWLEEITIKDKSVTENTSNCEWVTIFERRKLSEDDPYKVPYQEYKMSHSALLRNCDGKKFDELETMIATMYKLHKYSENDSITVEDVEAIMMRNIEEPSSTAQQIALLMWHVNPITFMGYYDVVSIPNFFIKKYGLISEGLNLSRNDGCVVRYESWLEGYQDEAYSREELSWGNRLLIERNFLKEICDDYKVSLYLSKTIKRKFYKWNTDKEPEKKSQSNLIVKYVIS